MCKCIGFRPGVSRERLTFSVRCGILLRIVLAKYAFTVREKIIPANKKLYRYIHALLVNFCAFFWLKWQKLGSLLLILKKIAIYLINSEQISIIHRRICVGSVLRQGKKITP